MVYTEEDTRIHARMDDTMPTDEEIIMALATDLRDAVLRGDA